MAIQNQIILNGQIKKIKKIQKVINEEKEIIQISLALFVIRRPQAAIGNKNGEIKTDIVMVVTKDKRIINYLCEHHAAEGDMLEVSGVFCTLRANKHFICSHCGQQNTYVGTTSFVHPLCVRLDELKPKNIEIVNLTEAERHLPKEEIFNLLRERKAFPGDIIQLKDLGEKNGLYQIQITVREKPSPEDVKNWLLWMSDISNRIYLIGNLCNDPSYNPIDNGGRVCTYQLGINRKVFIKDDDPSVKADYPWVKSLGEQADKDKEALRKGSLVFIDGSVQAKENFIVRRNCDFCGEMAEKRDSAMEIVPYSVEYLKNCLSIEEDVDDYNDIPETLELEEELEDSTREGDNTSESHPETENETGSYEEENPDDEWNADNEGYTPDNREEEWDQEDEEDYGFHPEDYSDEDFGGFSSMYGEDGDS